MEYRTLEPHTLMQLRVERLQDIEAQHYRVALRREETAEGSDERAAADRELADLARRWDVHDAALPTPDAPGPDTDEEIASALVVEGAG